MLQSPPSWRRGLKFVNLSSSSFMISSPPSRRRGLKSSLRISYACWSESPPSRRCGLKSKSVEGTAFPLGRLLHGGRGEIAIIRINYMVMLRAVGK